jgi:hypothetical protein
VPQCLRARQNQCPKSRDSSTPSTKRRENRDSVQTPSTNPPEFFTTVSQKPHDLPCFPASPHTHPFVFCLSSFGVPAHLRKIPLKIAPPPAPLRRFPDELSVSQSPLHSAPQAQGLNPWALTPARHLPASRFTILDLRLPHSPATPQCLNA